MTSLRDVAGAYDVFLIDQFGVLHDGQKPYPGAVDVLDRLHAAGKTIIVLTNSGKRSKPNFERLIRMGFSPASITHLVSSGEVTWQGIRDSRYHQPRPGGRVFVVGKSGDDYGLDGLGLTFTAHAEGGDAMLILGSNAPATSLDAYREMFTKAAAARIPALCANPDKEMLTPAGLQPAPGRIAKVYQCLGGQVTFTGKPYAEIYEFALRLVHCTDRTRVLAIGDSVEHDIAGAVHAGLKTALILGGILADKSKDDREHLYRQHAAEPDHVLVGLTW